MARKRGNGEGTIYKRSDGRWSGQATVGRNTDGSPKRRAVYGKSRKEVADKIAEILSDIKTGDYIEPNKTTLGEWLDIWMRDYKTISLKETTYDSYSMNIRVHIKPCIGYISLFELSVSHIQGLINTLHRQGKSSALIRKIKNILKGALDQAVANGMISRNVVGGVTLPKHTQKEIRWLSVEEERTFINAAKGNRLEVAFKLALVTGLRLGELIGLTWDCIDLNIGVITIKQTLIRVKSREEEGKNLYYISPTTKTKKSMRRVPIPKSAIKMLKEHKKTQNAEKKLAGELYTDNNLVFCTALGNRLIPRNVERSFANIIRDAGIEGASVHSLRHTYATRLFENGVAAKTVSELLGHTDVTHTLNVYTHVANIVKEKAVEFLDYVFDCNNDSNYEENEKGLRTQAENIKPANATVEHVMALQVT